MRAPSVWQGKYATLADYYKAEFSKTYYQLDQYELEIDPDHGAEQFNQYAPAQQRLEKIKCGISFPYFATKYARILHPKKGLIPCIMYKYQRHVINEYEKNRFNIIRKFRQGGLTTITEIWGLWRCLFKKDQQILFLSKTDREAITAGEIVSTACKYLPEWMLSQSKVGKWNDHQKQFDETGGNIHFGTPERARGLAITYLILDEAAFIPDMDYHWKAMYPTLSTGGNAIVISTVNGLGNWYQQVYYDAKAKQNEFNVIDLHYKYHPDYNNDKWVREQKAQLGDKGWQQEVLGSFLGSGETYIPAKVIGTLQERTRDNVPKKMAFAAYANALDSQTSWQEKGALWIWKQPIDGHDYILGVDAAEGIGDEGDNSCIEVVDSSTLEQVAEFYSNNVQPYKFSGIVAELASMYNHGLVVLENMGPGGSVLNNLQHQHQYDNIYNDPNVKIPKPGLKVGLQNRLVILETLQQRLMNDTAAVNSWRLVQELNTFNYNKTTHKIMADKGKHDDAVMALAFALYVRDTMIRDIPTGADVPRDIGADVRASVIEEIKRELMIDRDEDLLLTKKSNILQDQEDSNVAFNIRRKYHGILQEFGFFWLVSSVLVSLYATANMLS